MEAKLVFGFNGVPSPSPTNRVSTTTPTKVNLGKSRFWETQRHTRRTNNKTHQFTPTKISTSSSTHTSGGRGLLSIVNASSLPSSPKSSTKLYVSGLSFRTTEAGLRSAFEKFGQLVEVNLVMDRVANRPRGFAFLHYATDEESQSAIEGMHGKFLDGRVIFVEVAKPRSQLRQSPNPISRRY